MVYRDSNSEAISAVKAAIPYLDPKIAMRMSIVIKLLEIKSIIEYYKDIESGDYMSTQEFGKGAIDGLSPAKKIVKEILDEFMQNNQGKSQAELMPLLMGLTGRLNKHGINLLDHKDTIFSIIQERLSDEDKAKFDSMAKMFMNN